MENLISVGLLVAVLAAVWYLFFSRRKPPGKPPEQVRTPKEETRRTEALDSLQTGLQALKDQRRRVESEIDKDPAQAAETLRRMMKR